jgi:AmpD protein
LQKQPEPLSLTSAVVASVNHDLVIEPRPCDHWDQRPADTDISLLVIHNISLPPGQYRTPYIDDFFGGRLDCTAHPYFAQLKDVRVSAHCVIFRDGRICQYVPFTARAWHAGLSLWRGRDKCNDFSIGIELEGCDDEAYTAAQYQSLLSLCQYLYQQFPTLAAGDITGHSDIAPGRKTDPGPAFDWPAFRSALAQRLTTAQT